MLWHKGWLERKLRLLLWLGFTGFYLIVFYAMRATVSTPGPNLAAAFSLPVSWFGLLAVRASLGWLEMAGSIAVWCCGSWLALPVVRESVTGMKMFEYAVTLVACVSLLNLLSVLLSTFLDEQWRMWGTMLAFVAVWLISNALRLPVSVHIIRAIGDGSPLVAHTMPWSAMAFSPALSVVLFFAALKVVQAREY